MRPQPKFHDFVGQKDIVDTLRNQLAGAKRLAEPFPHTLFLGHSGVGKTLLANALATEFGTALHVVSGRDNLESLAGHFEKASDCDFVFIDEAHTLGARHQDLLLAVIDSNAVPAWALREPPAKAEGESPTEPAVRRRTVVLATDQPGVLINAVRERMELPIRLRAYTDVEMSAIVDQMATKQMLRLSAQARNLLASVANGYPRRARHLLANLRRHASLAGDVQLGLDDVRAFLVSVGIDDHGLDRDDRAYLRFVNSVRRASIESIGLHLGVGVDHVRIVLEPRLQSKGLIVIGPGGRTLTSNGIAMVASAEANMETTTHGRSEVGTTVD